MKKRNVIPENAARLRQKAEQKLKERKTQTEKAVSEADKLKLIHELEVHQIELELQNDELVRAKETAEQAEEKYTELYDFSPSGYLSLTKEGEILNLNFAAARMLGKERAKLVNNRFSAFLSHNTRSVFNQFLEKTFTRKVKQTCEVITETKDNSGPEGGSLPIYVTVEGIVNQNGKLCHLTVVDITKRKQTEQKLIKSHKLFELFFHNSLEGFFFMMLDEPVEWNDNIDKEKTLDYVFSHQRITQINEAMLQQYGAKKEDFLKLTPGDLFSHDLKHGRDVWRKFFDEGNLLIDTTEKKLDGTDMIITGSYTCLYDDKGRITGHFGVQRDVTAERKTKEALEESNSMLDTTNRMAKVGGWQLDVKTKEVTWTKETYRIHEVPLDQKPSLEDAVNFFHPDEREKLTEAIKFAFKGEAYDLELKFITVTGKELWTRTMGEPIIENGEVIKLKGTFQDITERKQAEEALKESEEKFRALYNNAPLSYQSLNEDGSFNDINPAWLRTLGYERDDVIGKFYRDFLHQDSRSHFDKNFPAFKKRGYVHDVQFKIRHKKGHYLDVSFEGCVGYNPDGRFKQTYCVFQDITERKQAEEALKKSEQLFSQMFEQSIVSTQLLDLQGNTIRVNPQFCKLFGVTKEDMMHYKIFEDDAIKESDAYTPLRDVFENKNAHKWFNQFNIALASESSGVKTNRPETIFLENLSYPIIDSEENLQYVVIQHHDVTKRKKAEQNLKENRFYLAKAQEIGNIGTWKLDLINNELIWTEQNYLNFGIPTGTRLTYEIFLECIHPDDRDYVNEEWMAALDGKPYDIEHRIIVDSKVRWVREKADVEFDDNNRAISAIGFTQDITQRKQTEEALVESQRLGAIGEMTSAVAHDFNNSLQTIFGNLELALLNPDIPERVRQYLEVVKEASGDAAARVQLLQRFGGKQQNKSQHFPINMNEIINDVINQSRPLWKNEAEKKGLEITIEPKYGEIPKIAGNDGELRSVVYNIIKNAVEAMPDGGVITIETGEESERVFVRITDSGKGMDEETRARIFQPFYSTKGFELGRGLGMSGAYTILHEHHGSIKVKATAPGIGTTIELLLPVAEGEEISEDKEPVAGSEGIAKILWVDDDNAICELAKEILNCLGHEGDVAHSGQEALEFLAEKTYDLVITDLGMPGMTGWQLADEIKKLYKEKIKVAVVTGWGFQVSEEEKVAHGVGYVLGKPVKLKDVESLIEEVMQVR
ncbi:MAG: hypothetical protein SCALA702_34310 [Melioribacteraceae bacterium]|nr:MAG: hypothetical protein SCALA702_34310 [Melioribacteraceae bacterium]